jgi:hypothetical protein
MKMLSLIPKPKATGDILGFISMVLNMLFYIFLRSILAHVPLRNWRHFTIRRTFGTAISPVQYSSYNAANLRYTLH